MTTKSKVVSVYLKNNSNFHACKINMSIKKMLKAEGIFFINDSTNGKNYMSQAIIVVQDE